MCYLTDGRIKDTDLPLLLPDAATLADELVTTGLWKRTRGGYVFNDWLEWGGKRTAAEIRAVRAKKAEAGRLGGLASGQVRHAKARRDETKGGSRRSKREADPLHERPVDNASEAPKQGVTSDDARSKREPNAKHRASCLVEPPALPSPATKTMVVPAVNSNVEGVIHSPPNGKPDYSPSFEAERKRQMDALMAMAREEAAGA